LMTRAATVAPPRAWALLGVVYLAAMLISSVRWHFGPDSRFYLAWAYRIGGLSEVEAGERTYVFLNGFDWFADYCWYACDTSEPGLTYSWLFRGEEGGLFRQRLLYPALSAPFVRLFGPAGMLVVPAIAFTAYVIMVVVLANRMVGRSWAVPAGIAAILPISIAKFSLYAYTETLATALLLGCVLLLPLRPTGASDPAGGSDPTRVSRRHIIGFAVLLVLFAFTRQFHLALVLGVVVTWLGVALRQRRLRNPWGPFAAVSVAAAAVIAVVQTLMSPGYSLLTPFLKISGAETVGGIPKVLPSVVWRIVSGEIEVAGQDFGLVLVAMLGAAGIVAARRTEFAWLTVGILVGTFLLEMITALPSQNRYWALSVPLLAIHATAFVARVLGRDDGRPAAGPRSAGERPGHAGGEPAVEPASG
jgi:hypothetical protein